METEWEKFFNARDLGSDVGISRQKTVENHTIHGTAIILHLATHYSVLLRTAGATFPSDSIEKEWLNSENAKFHPSLLFQRRKAKKTRNLLQHPNLNHRKRITTQLEFPMSVIPLPLMGLVVKLRQTKARKQPSRKLSMQANLELFYSLTQKPPPLVVSLPRFHLAPIACCEEAHLPPQKARSKLACSATITNI